MAEAAIGLGSNIGAKIANVDRAVAALECTAAIELVARSANYKTDPWGVTDQDWFINACVIVETTLTPRRLLNTCLRIEADLGRRRGRRWGPRVIDLDILYYDDAVVDEPGLTIPHPHMMERVFVLAPLAELVPDRVVAGARVADALAGLDPSGARKLDVMLAAE